MKNNGTIPVDWPAPANVKAFYTTRCGGASSAPYDSFNLGLHVGDNPAHVLQNRQHLIDALTGLETIAWLDQVHGNEVFFADNVCEKPPQADAGITTKKHLGCAVMTADCLPVLFCDKNGKQVAAAHAGWRGLVNGVLEKTVAQFTSPSSQLMAWFGPAIGPEAFEVGAEVRQAFMQASKNPGQDAAAFIENPAKASHFYADLYQLARLRLQRAGITAIYGGDFCTYHDRKNFYSYRREAITGRMASLIYLSD